MGPFRLSHFLALLLFPFVPFIEAASWQNEGRILFLVQQGEVKQALELYRQYYTASGQHDFELLHRIGLGILNEGFSKSSPEPKLMALFGSGVSAHEDTYYIVEESLKSPYPQIQLVAIQALSRLQSPRMDQALNRALASDYVATRLEAAHQLCLRQHPKAISQTESLMYKVPTTYWSLFPQLYILVENKAANQLIKRLLNHNLEEVRLAAILSIAKHKRDDFLPKIRQLASHASFAQQEACIYALGALKDGDSIPRLKRLKDSQYPLVALAASQALYRISKDKEGENLIRQAASTGNLVAIRMLGEVDGTEDFLAQLFESKDLQIRLQATLSLLEKKDGRCLEGLKEILIDDKRNVAFISTDSPGKAFTTWKAIPSACQVLKEDLSAIESTLELRKDILERAQKLSEEEFLILADAILAKKQLDLALLLVQLLEESGSSAAISLLKKYHQQAGSPFIRQCCNLALYRLKEEGPYRDYLQQWAKSQQKEPLIRFQDSPSLSLEPRQLKTTYKLEPEEVSKLLISTFEAFAAQQDQEGIEVLLEAIENGNTLNRYALAGLLLRATQ